MFCSSQRIKAPSFQLQRAHFSSENVASSFVLCWNAFTIWNLSHVLMFISSLQEFKTQERKASLKMRNSLMLCDIYCHCKRLQVYLFCCWQNTQHNLQLISRKLMKKIHSKWLPSNCTISNIIPRCITRAKRTMGVFLLLNFCCWNNKGARTLDLTQQATL